MYLTAQLEAYQDLSPVPHPQTKKLGAQGRPRHIVNCRKEVGISDVSPMYRADMMSG